MAKGQEPYLPDQWRRGEKPPKGWDAADAIEDGWTKDDIHELLFPEEHQPQKDEPLPDPDHPPAGATDIHYDPMAQWDLDLDFALTSKGDRDRKALVNVILMTRHHPALQKLFGFDEFKHSILVLRQPPWKTPAGPYPRRYEKVVDASGLCAFLELHGQLRPTVDTCHAQAMKMALENRVDTLHMMLAQLPQWDGEARLDTWLIDHLGADDTPYTRSVGAKALIGAMARASWKHGDAPVKVDGTLILEGAQGIGKSKVVAALAGDTLRFYLSMGNDFANKDASIAVTSTWLVELAELASLGRTSVAVVKKFLTETHDSYRPPYETEVRPVIRRCVFIGTVNPGHNGRYLADETGNRRFWPVRVSKRLDDKAFAAVRDQLLAEALHRFRAGESWWLETRQEELLAEQEQDSRAEQSPLLMDLQQRLTQETENELTMSDLLTMLGVLGARDRNDRALQTSIGRAMAELGWRSVRRKVKGVKTSTYVRPTE